MHHDPNPNPAPTILNSQLVTRGRDELTYWRVDQTLTSAGCPLAVALGKPIGEPRGAFKLPPPLNLQIF